MAVTIQSFSIHMPKSSRCHGSMFFNWIVYILSSCGGYDKVNILDSIFNILYIYQIVVKIKFLDHLIVYIRYI